MTLSNKLTICRIVLTFVFMFFLFSKGVASKSAALVIFILAACTDYLDGWLAKRRMEITDFGKVMDPIADKILTIAAFLAFVEMELVPAWMVLVIILRELIITSFRLLALMRGRVMEAAAAGKHKTVSQLVSILVTLVFIVIREAGVRVFYFWNASFEYWYRQAIFVLMLVTVALTVISGASYLVRNRRYLTLSRNGKAG